MSQEPADQGGRKPPRIGKYEVLSHIASGGMGAVYKARDVELDRVVALKILSPELAVKDQMVKRFFREARAAAQLSHENIVSIYDFGEHNGTHFLALEFIDGIDLYEYINRKGKLDVAEATMLLTQAAQALDHAHQRNIVHRDIKPSNFLITQVGGQARLKLTDLGLARQVREDEARVTRVGSTVGTVDYMAPEQARSSSAADIRSDIYALGCTLYHMLSGSCPFPQASLAEKLIHHLEHDPVDITQVNPQVSARLAAILKKMMAKKQADRFQTPAELLLALEGKSPVIEMVSGETMKALHELAAEATRPRAAAAEATRSQDANATRERAVGPAQPPRTASRVAPPLKPARPLPARPPAQRRPDYNDEGTTSTEKPAPPLPAWWPYAAGGIGVLAATILIYVQLTSTGSAPDEGVKHSPPPPVTPTVEKKKDPVLPPPVKQEEPSNFVGPEDPGWPKLYQAAAPLDVVALREEFNTRFAHDDPVPENPRLIRIGRTLTPGAGVARSLTDAWAQAEEGGWTILELHDDGPFFEASLPPRKGGKTWIRPAPGFRPLIVWMNEGQANPTTTAALLSVVGGLLVVDGMDFGVQGDAAIPEATGCFIHSQTSQVRVRACTFSQAGKFGAGLQVIQLSASDADKSPGRCGLLRCFLRGHDLTAVRVKDAAADVVLEGCLVVGNQQPLIDITNHEDLPVSLKLVRSTLAAGQQVARWQGTPGKDRKPHLHIKAWDTILARTRTGGDPDMIVLPAGALPESMTFKAINCLYAGWKNWLVADGRTLSADQVAAWHKQWGLTEGDKDLSVTWPRRFPSRPEEVPAKDFSPIDTLACYAATTNPGMIGCAIGALPPTPRDWLQRTFERYAINPLPLPESDVPAIPLKIPGVYQGEKLDLTKVDLGQHLAKKLDGKVGPKVVLHLSGKGKIATSPLLIKDIPHLILYFEPRKDKDKSEPLALRPLAAAAGEAALIDVNNSKVEIIQGNVFFDNSKTVPLPAHMFRVRGGGELLLQHCQLHGPLANAPEGYQGLIHVEENPELPERGGISLKDTILRSQRNLLSVRGQASVRSRGCVWIAPDNAFAWELPAPSRRTVLWSLENNTFAIGQSLLSVQSGPGEGDGKLVIQALNNYILDPYQVEPRQACLIRYQGPALARSALVWQGQNNAFDRRRLHAFVSPVTDTTPARQEFSDWLRFWGKPSEREALLIDLPTTSKTFSLNAVQYDALALPDTIRPRPSGSPVYGADLDRLGLGKKK